MSKLPSALLALLRCSRAGTQAELEEVQRFRYTVYVAELGKSLAVADHQRKMLVDPLDEGAWHFVCRAPGGTLVGSCRLHCGTQLPAGLERAMGITAFMTQFPHPVGYISRLMFTRDLRGHGAVLRLLSHVYSAGRDAGAVICFNHCSPRLAPAYEKLGLHRFGCGFVDAEVGPQVPMVQILEDEARYRECASPLLKDCLRYANDASRVQELRNWFLTRDRWRVGDQRPLHDREHANRGLT